MAAFTSNKSYIPFDDPAPSYTSSTFSVLFDSDQEGTDSASSVDDSYSESDYWFGKMHFRYVLAQDVQTRTTPGTSISTADSNLRSKLSQFSCQQALQQCYKQGISEIDCAEMPERDAFSAFMTLIGYVMRIGSKDAVEKLSKLLKTKQRAIKPDLRSSRRSASIKSEESFATESPIQPMPLAAAASQSDPDLPRYTSHLKEQGDVKGFRPVYKYKQMSLDPPMFKALVIFRDYVFEGQGCSKKQARHEASKEACKGLKYDLP